MLLAASNRKPTQTNLNNMEMHYHTEWQCDLAPKQVSELVKPATQVSQQGLNSIPTFFCVQGWFHPKATSPYSQRTAASGSSGYILPSSRLAGAKLSVTLSSEQRINFPETLTSLFSCPMDWNWFPCPSLAQSLSRAIRLSILQADTSLELCKAKFPTYKAAPQ